MLKCIYGENLTTESERKNPRNWQPFWIYANLTHRLPPLGLFWTFSLSFWGPH